jgi:hypothetical protein
MTYTISKAHADGRHASTHPADRAHWIAAGCTDCALLQPGESGTPAPDLTAADVLAAHREVWDMPTLCESRPDVLAWLEARFEVHFGMMSDVIIVDKATGRPTGHPTTDVREALLTTLTGLVG